MSTGVHKLVHGKKGIYYLLRILWDRGGQKAIRWIKGQKEDKEGKGEKLKEATWWTN
jgi:hypothetical protein